MTSVCPWVNRGISVVRNSFQVQNKLHIVNYSLPSTEQAALRELLRVPSPTMAGSTIRYSARTLRDETVNLFSPTLIERADRSTSWLARRTFC